MKINTESTVKETVTKTKLHVLTYEHPLIQVLLSTYNSRFFQMLQKHYKESKHKKNKIKKIFNIQNNLKYFEFLKAVNLHLPS